VLFEVLFVTRVDKSTYLDKQETVNAIAMLPLGTFIVSLSVLPTSKTADSTVGGIEFQVSSISSLQRSDTFKYGSRFRCISRRTEWWKYRMK